MTSTAVVDLMMLAALPPVGMFLTTLRIVSHPWRRLTRRDCTVTVRIDRTTMEAPRR